MSKKKIKTKEIDKIAGDYAKFFKKMSIKYPNSHGFMEFVGIIMLGEFFKTSLTKEEFKKLLKKLE